MGLEGQKPLSKSLDSAGWQGPTHEPPSVGGPSSEYSQAAPGPADYFSQARDHSVSSMDPMSTEDALHYNSVTIPPNFVAPPFPHDIAPWLPMDLPGLAPVPSVTVNGPIPPSYPQPQSQSATAINTPRQWSRTSSPYASSPGPTTTNESRPTLPSFPFDGPGYPQPFDSTGDVLSSQTTHRGHSFAAIGNPTLPSFDRLRHSISGGTPRSSSPIDSGWSGGQALNPLTTSPFPGPDREQTNTPPRFSTPFMYNTDQSARQEEDWVPRSRPTSPKRKVKRVKKPSSQSHVNAVSAPNGPRGPYEDVKPAAAVSHTGSGLAVNAFELEEPAASKKVVIACHNCRLKKLK